MAREEFRGRQFTIYLPTPKYLEIWRERAKAANTSLNHYILEAVDSIGEQLPSPKTDTDELNKLRAENQQLKAELERIRLRDARFEMAEKAMFETTHSEGTFSPIPFKEALVNDIRSGGYWTSAKINRKFQGYIAIGARPGKILDELVDLGLIKETARGWVWIK